MKSHKWNDSISGSRLIYGCMTIGGNWKEKPVSEEDRKGGFAAIDAALENGYTIFDHADIYCKGKSEQLFGEYLSAHPDVRERITLQSKCGIKFPSKPTDHHRHGLPVRFDFSYRHIVDSVDGTLKRLQIDSLDILLLHRPDPLVEPEEVARAFDTLRSNGKVKHFGVSNHSAAQMQLLESKLDVPLAANQLEVSLLHPDLVVAGTAVNQRQPDYHMRASDALEHCRMRGIQLQAWSPLAKGYLSGRELPKKSPAEERERVAKAGELVKNLASDHGVSPEAIVLAWILRHPASILPVVGTTSPDRIAAATEADRVEMTHEEWYLLVEAARGMSMP